MSRSGLIEVSVSYSDLVAPTIVKVPFLRPQQSKPRRLWPRIEVGADSMRIGKTTAVAVLQQEFAKRGLPVQIGAEEWQHNIYLQDSYDVRDPEQLSKFLLKSQRWFAKRKYEQITREVTDAIHIQDVDPEMDFCYALTNRVLGRMQEADFMEYVEYYLSLEWGMVTQPDLLVYLTASDEVLVERARKSVRDFEAVGTDYFITMSRINKAWLQEACERMSVLVIDTDGFDFSVEGEAQSQLATMVLLELNRLGWKLLPVV